MGERGTRVVEWSESVWWRRRGAAVVHVYVCTHALRTLMRILQEVDCMRGGAEVMCTCMGDGEVHECGGDNCVGTMMVREGT
jgi:hypothetical protein